MPKRIENTISIQTFGIILKKREKEWETYG